MFGVVFFSFWTNTNEIKITTTTANATATATSQFQIFLPSYLFHSIPLHSIVMLSMMCAFSLVNFLSLFVHIHRNELIFIFLEKHISPNTIDKCTHIICKHQRMSEWVYSMVIVFFSFVLTLAAWKPVNWTIYFNSKSPSVNTELEQYLNAGANGFKFLLVFTVTNSIWTNRQIFLRLILTFFSVFFTTTTVRTN